MVLWVVLQSLVADVLLFCRLLERLLVEQWEQLLEGCLAALQEPLNPANGKLFLL